ncbi:unnamed protein product [Prorocentrum cordatum]|uniref:Uncharacterized protein n=1 Tax=Prorocentrum cordatum TaxID=2364126 RepID=A0ABN9WB83_9DINO|nr:unnamed protein product [Polarella glacialis]
MARRVPAAGSLLLGLLACGARAERAWGTALQAELAMPASGSLHWLGGGRDQSAGPGEAESPLGPVLQPQGPHRQSSAAGGGPRPTGPEKAESFRASGDGGGPLRSGGPPDRLAVPGAKLVRESSQLGALGSVRPVARRAHSTEEEQAAASGTDAREQRRFLEHLHADGTPPDALARAEQQLDGSGVREKAVLLPEEPAVDCNTKDPRGRHRPQADARHAARLHQGPGPLRRADEGRRASRQGGQREGRRGAQAHGEGPAGDQGGEELPRGMG